ncbi:MAG: AI-2E family transporter [Bacteroidetes bacterium]|nr:AI-2E family transporter [Bacteroidota bacterium]
MNPISRPQLKIPFYAKTALVFIAAFAFVFVLYIGQHIIVPILYATIVAILLNPFVNFLENRKMNRIVAISLAVILVFFITACFIYFLYFQVSMFADTYPQLKAKTEILINQLVLWTSEHFNFSVAEINLWIANTEAVMFRDSGQMLGRTLISITNTLVVLFLLPVYLFMILYYKPLLLEFIRQLFDVVHRTKVLEVLGRSKGIIQSYLVGLLIEILIMSILNSAGLLILGIDYAIILGITGALLNVIPYIGGIVGTALPMMIAFITKDSATYPLMVLAVYLIIQLIDNNFIVPMVVGSKVKLNALVSIIVVIIGGAIWGISGMFLSIPLLAILKVVFDNVESLRPWGFLLGNIVPATANFAILEPIKNKIKKFV